MEIGNWELVNNYFLACGTRVNPKGLICLKVGFAKGHGNSLEKG